MEVLKKWKKNIIRRCKSSKEKNKVEASTNTNNNSINTLPKSKSYPPWCSPNPKPNPNPNPRPMRITPSIITSPSSSPRPRHLTPGGCFSVYVGPERERFVMKAKDASHPLFKMLLDDAQEQYGYNSEGPILLPCSVDLFYKVLAEMDDVSSDVIHPHCCGSYGSYALFSPSRLLKLNHF
ncbi:hypothetical protein vseg_017278 [Gypsophila vaccaria]